MKQIVLITNAVIGQDGKPTDSFITTADVIRAVANQPGSGGGVSVTDLRKRVRLLDAVDAAENGFVRLEDADHEFLARLVNNFQFGLASRELLAVVDGILNPAPA